MINAHTASCKVYQWIPRPVYEHEVDSIVSAQTRPNTKVVNMGNEEMGNDIQAIADNASAENGDVKSISSDDALLISMGKEPELKRLVYYLW